MASNLYRFSTLGETLEASLKVAAEKKNIQPEVIDKIWEKFDEIATRSIKDEAGQERAKNSHIANINAIEHEFKLHDGIASLTLGVWKFILKKVGIRLEYEEISTEYLKGNFLWPNPQLLPATCRTQGTREGEGTPRE